MSHPGSFSGDPAGRQPDPAPYPANGAFEYPPTDPGVPLPPPYSQPPPWYSTPQQMPPGAFPPPPPYYPYDSAYPQYPPPQYGPQYGPAYGAPVPANGLAIGSLVSSLIGIPGYFLCFGFIGSILGVILGIVALNQIGKNGQKGKGMAIAGIVIGALGLVGMGLLSLLIASPSLWY